MVYSVTLKTAQHSCAPDTSASWLIPWIPDPFLLREGAWRARLAVKEVEACSRSRQCTSLALWGWNVISVIVPIPRCSLYMSVTLEVPGTRSRAWLVALLHRDLAKDDTSQSLHGSGTVASDGVFEQAPQMDAKHFRMCDSSLRVRSWSRKPMHGQYCCLTEQSPVDTKETFGWLKAANVPGATEGLVVAAQEMSVPLAACAVQAWK